MALDGNYFKFTFNNKQEYIISHNKSEIKEVIGSLSEGLLHSDYIELRYDESEPLFIKKQNLFSVQKMNKEAVGNQTRIWRLL